MANSSQRMSQFLADLLAQGGSLAQTAELKRLLAQVQGLDLQGADLLLTLADGTVLRLNGAAFDTVMLDQLSQWLSGAALAQLETLIAQVGPGVLVAQAAPAAPPTTASDANAPAPSSAPSSAAAPAAEEAGKLSETSGTVKVIRGGQEIQLKAGDAILNGDTVLTEGGAAKLQLVAKDGATLAVALGDKARVVISAAASADASGAAGAPGTGAGTASAAAAPAGGEAAPAPAGGVSFCL